MLFLCEDPEALQDPVPRRVGVMRDEEEDDVETPVLLLGRVLMELPLDPRLMSPGRFIETMG